MRNIGSRHGKTVVAGLFLFCTVDKLTFYCYLCLLTFKTDCLCHSRLTPISKK